MVELVQGRVGTGKDMAEILSTFPNHRRPNRSGKLLRTAEVPTTSGVQWTAESRKTVEGA